MIIVLSLAPIFLLILLGYAIRKKKIIDDTFWMPAERITYYIFFPSLLISNIAGVDLDFLALGPMIGAVVSGILIIGGSVIALRPYITVPNPAFTSIFQGSIRPNSYVGIAAAVALFGDAGLSLVAIIISVAVPLVNFLSAVMLAHYIPQENGATGARRLIMPVITNPLILSCMMGIFLNLSGLGLPPVLGPLLDILGKAALPVGLLAVGAGLSFKALHGSAAIMLATSTAKIILLPLVTYLALKAFGVEGLSASIAVIYATLPGSPSAYVLARQMGGDGELMAGLITLTTLAAMVLMPAIALMLG